MSKSLDVLKQKQEWMGEMHGHYKTEALKEMLLEAIWQEGISEAQSDWADRAAEFVCDDTFNTA